MRPDMAQVLIERPRSGSFEPYALSKRPLSKKESHELIKETKRRLERERKKRRQYSVMVSVV